MKNYSQIRREKYIRRCEVNFVPSSISMKVHVVCLVSYDISRLPAESERMSNRCHVLNDGERRTGADENIYAYTSVVL